MAGKNRYKTIVADPPAGGALGSRNEAVIQGLFSTSPLSAKSPASIAVEKYSEKLNLTEAGLSDWFAKSVLNGTVPDSNTYYGFSQEYSLNYSGAPGDDTTGTPPNLKTVKTGGAGLPATPWTPNPASPGEGNGVDASKIPEATDFANVYLNKTPMNHGSGDSANQESRNPAVSSANMKNTTLGSTLGKSPATAAKNA